MKIVITGGAGFIGSHVSEYWDCKNAEVHVIDNLRSGYEKNLSGLKNVTLHKGSITDYDLVESVLENADYVFNLAALVSVPESLLKPEECVSINVNGLLNILKASVKQKVKKVVHTSSAAVYGDNPELPKKVTMRPEPKSPYGITKLDGEYYCGVYSAEFGLPTVSLRPRQDPQSQYAAAVPIFIHRAAQNKDIIIYGDGGQTRDFIYVKDIVRANVSAAEKIDARGVFNVANGKSITIKELANKIIKLSASRSKIVFADERPGDIKHSVASIEETINVLDFHPSNSFDEDLRTTIEFFLKAEI
jgi:UDP-glucose 4-epimerase